MADQNASTPRSHRSGSESSKFDGISMHCGACCCLSAAAATCMLLFFSLHSSKADSNADDVGPSWAIVLAPLIILSLGVLLALVAALACVRMRSQAAGHPFMPTGVVPTAAPKPSVRLVATYGLSALGVLLVCLQIIHAERHAGQPRLPWALALSPVALMLGVRAVTVPPPLPLAFGAPEPDGLICWRWVNRAEILLGGAALVRLYAMVRATESGGGAEGGTDGSAVAGVPMGGWWGVVAPLLLLDVMRLVAGVRAVASASRTSQPPLKVRAPRRTRATLLIPTPRSRVHLDVCAHACPLRDPPPRLQVVDRAAWVFHRERRAICEGFAILLGALLRLAVWWAAAGQLQQRSVGAAGVSGGRDDADNDALLMEWRATYVPFALFSGLVVCCCCGCCLLPSLMLPLTAPPSQSGVQVRDAAAGEGTTQGASGPVGASCCNHLL